MSRKIISNASPLIFLAKIDRLHLLKDLFDDVLVPNGAWVEATRKPDAVTVALNDLQSAGLLSVFTVKNLTAVSAMVGRLHIGEVEVIVDAGELDIPNVILDDGYARSKAKQLRLSVTGTLGLLIAGCKKGVISDIEAEINKLRSIGFRISDTVVEQIKSIV